MKIILYSSKNKSRQRPSLSIFIMITDFSFFSLGKFFLIFLFYNKEVIFNLDLQNDSRKSMSAFL